MPISVWKQEERLLRHFKPLLGRSPETTVVNNRSDPFLSTARHRRRGVAKNISARSRSVQSVRYRIYLDRFSMYHPGAGNARRLGKRSTENGTCVRQFESEHLGASSSRFDTRMFQRASRSNSLALSNTAIRKGMLLISVSNAERRNRR